MTMNELVQEIILQALREHPEGLTTKQITKIVRKKLKKIEKMLDIAQTL